MAGVDIAETVDVQGLEDSGTGLEQDAQNQSIEALLGQMEAIDESLPRGLAALHGAPDSVVGATIAAYRSGTRMLMSSMSMLEAGEDEIGRLRVSERGKQVIAACAERYPRVDTDVDAALRAARDLLAHSEHTGQLKVK